MLHVDFKKAIGLSALAVGLATSAFGQTGPYQFFSQYLAPNKGDLVSFQQYDLDFTKKSLDPALDYPTFPNPRAPQNIVKFQPHFFAVNFGFGSCFEIISTGPAGSDLAVSALNQSANYVWLADDNYGGGQFRLRFFIKAGPQFHVRVHEYASPNNNNRSNIIVRQLNLDPGAAITATSCRAAGLPYWQYDLNAGNPYNPS
jgi:hypothetical protein